MNRSVAGQIIWFVLFAIVGILPAHAVIKITAVGDSITQGIPYYTSHGNGCTNCGQYTYRLEALLDANSWSASTVYNYGVAGESSNKGAARIPGIISSKNPEYVLFMEGTNDLLDVSPATVAARVEIGVNNILNAGKIAIVGTLIPDLKYAPKPDKKGIPETNGYIRSMVTQKQGADKNVFLAELHDDGYWGWGSSPTMSSDGTHPNTTGYQQMAAIWYGVFEELLRPDFLPAVYLLLLD